MAARHAVPDVTVRLATTGDADAIHAGIAGIASSMGERHRVTSTVDDIRRAGFGDAPLFEALIAESGGRTLGVCVFIRSFSTYRGRPGAYVQDIFVAPNARGKGVGKAMLSRLATLVRARDWAYIRLSVDAANSKARGFYSGMGLRHSEGELIYGIYGDDLGALAEKDIGEAAE